MDTERIEKERARQMLNEFEIQHKVGSEVQTGSKTYQQLMQDYQRVTEQVAVLECQKKTVVVYNKEKGTFEYIGEPLLLNFDKELTDLQEVLHALKEWVGKNPRLTVGAIFSSQDTNGFGELNVKEFEEAFAKLGVRLRPKELGLIQNALDQRGIGQIAYKPLVRELSGMPQIQFINKEVLKLAKMAEHRDLTKELFLKSVDPYKKEMMNKADFA